MMTMITMIDNQDYLGDYDDHLDREDHDDHLDYDDHLNHVKNLDHHDHLHHEDHLNHRLCMEVGGCTQASRRLSDPK